VTIDLLNLEWWQGLGAVLVALGLSPAPWILGLAAGRIQFTAPAREAYDARVVDIKDAHAKAIAELVAHHAALVVEKDRAYAEMQRSRDYYRTARLEEAERADRATEQLLEVVELAKTSAHALEALDEAARDANA
jgi:hypothetical protein